MWCSGTVGWLSRLSHLSKIELAEAQFDEAIQNEPNWFDWMFPTYPLEYTEAQRRYDEYREHTREQAKAYMKDNVGDGWTHEVERYVVLPGQATGYKIGMLKILDLRQMAMEQLGDQLDLKEFHRIVLSNGSMPLSILERVVLVYIDAKLGS